MDLAQPQLTRQICIMIPPEDFIAPAASMIVLQGWGDGAKVLMGQRAAGAAFMPSKFVFPGGRVDEEDHDTDLPDLLSPTCQTSLHLHPVGGPISPRALVAAGLRELAEETGLKLSQPRASALRFVFRAITPPGRSRRFDARFFLARAQNFDGDHAGFSAASGELSHLQWLPLTEARALDLPFITRVILAELEANLTAEDWAGSGGVPFFDNSGPHPAFMRL
jgi:8-oxo-dGTP pyrophosphatase MutT (NUDIX family)